MLQADRFLTRHPTRLSAYNDLQYTLMRRFLDSGGTLEEWCAVHAPEFRARYGWMLGDAAPTHLDSAAA